MIRPLANLFARLDAVYLDKSYFVARKVRLLVGFCLLLLALAPLNLVRLVWLEIPSLPYRIAFNFWVAGAAALSVVWALKGRPLLAGSNLVLNLIAAIHILVMLAPVEAQPLSAAILIFVVDLVALLLALVFCPRRIAFLVLLITLGSHWAYHYALLHVTPVRGSLENAADTLLREGMGAYIFVFVLGVILVRIIDSAQRRTEEALRETKALNDNLERLVTERTSDLHEASQRANDASRAKSDFLANMSHEIRTPLNGIIASADLLQHRPDLPADAATHVQLIAKSGELLLKQLGDILDFTKIEAGHLVLESHRFELNAVVSECMALLEVKAEEGGIRLDHSLAPGLHASYAGDSFRLRQILLNLLSNAIKFTPAGGHVRLTISPDASAEPSRVRFEVTDTGIGIDENAMKRLFERFTQADSSTTRRYGGTGLGLAISARLVERMGGRIEAESTPGRGSVFRFSVPLQPETETIKPESEKPFFRPPRLGLHVLVAEDNTVNQKILSAQLNTLACTYTIVTDGVQALAALQKAPLPTLILMDCQMPNLDGWATTQRIRAWARDPDASATQRAAAALPIIALTAAALPEERARCHDSGMNGFLSKPLKIAELLAALQPYARPAA